MINVRAYAIPPMLFFEPTVQALTLNWCFCAVRRLTPFMICRGALRCCLLPIIIWDVGVHKFSFGRFQYSPVEQ